MTLRSLLAGAALAGAALGAHAECVPDKKAMLKVVYRNVSPGIDAKSFAAQPKTLYRLGWKYGRLEEAPDDKFGIHGLMVVNQPDAWMVNLAIHAGDHVVDPDPQARFRAPVVGAPTGTATIDDLEFGCERAFFEERTKSKPTKGKVGARAVDRFEYAEGRFKITAAFASDGGKPVAVSLYEDGKLVYDLRYDEYVTGLKPNMSLFQKPLGIAIVEPEDRVTP